MNQELLLLEVYDVRQWLNKYPTHKAVDLRGNVNTRMQKLQDSDWNGAIFAAAGLERINLKPQNYINLDWMIPRPAQSNACCRHAERFVCSRCFI
jgi:porphobilinogen deaminase